MGGIEHISLGVFIAVSTASVLGIIAVVAVVCFELKNRHLRYIKMSSPNINLVIAGGCVLAYTSCVLLGMDNIHQFTLSSTSSICQLRIWTMSVSFTLVFGSMLAKSWRVRRIFKAASIKRLVIRDDKLIVFLALFLAVDLLILGLWTGIDPLTIQKQSLSLSISSMKVGSPVQEISNTTHQICTSKYYPGWVTVIFIYKCLMLLYGTYMCWAIRHVTVPSMNDSTPILISSYVTVVMASFGVAMTTLLNKWPDGVYASVATALWIPATTTVCLVYLPKVKMWRNKSGDSINRQLSMSNSLVGSPSNQNLEQFEEEMYHIVSENRTLKKSLTAKETTIKTLQEHVQKAKSKLLKFLDGKQDSGLDIDYSTSSLEHDDDGAPYEKRCGNRNDKGVTEVDSALRSQNLESNGAGLKHSNSMASINSYIFHRGNRNSQRKMSRLRDSIAQDLDTAQNLSHHLRSSIHRELNSAPFREKSYLYEKIRSKQDLAGAIANSYDLSDESDTYSYVSNCIRTSKVHHDYVNYESEGSIVCEPDTERHDLQNKHTSSFSSCHSHTSTLNNDCFYPSTSRQHKKKRSHRSWKCQPIPKVYTIQTPQEPCMLHSGMALTRNLQSSFDTFV